MIGSWDRGDLAERKPEKTKKKFLTKQILRDEIEDKKSIKNWKKKNKLIKKMI